MRAALTSSLARQGLIRALSKKPPQPNYWRWAAIAACVLVGTVTLTFWPSPKQETQEVAVAIKPQSVAAPAPLPEVKPTPKARAKAPASPTAAPAAVAADSPRQEIAEAASNSFAERSAPVAKLASAPPPIVAEIFNDNLILRAASGSHIYAFLIDGESVKPLSTSNETRRSIPIGSHSTKAEAWLIITTAEDPVLERALTGVLPLPTRNWIKLKTNP